MKYSPAVALSISTAVNNGDISIEGVGRQYGLDPKEVGVWCALLHAHGKDVFNIVQEFTRSERKLIVEEKLEKGLSLTESCVRHKILHRSSLRNWIREYKTGKLMSTSRTQKKEKEAKNARPEDDRSRIERLEKELLLAKAENAFLKKLQALMQQTKKS